MSDLRRLAECSRSNAFYMCIALKAVYTCAKHVFGSIFQGKRNSRSHTKYYSSIGQVDGGNLGRILVTPS